MKIIKEGTITRAPNGNIILDGWHVIGGSTNDIIHYAACKTGWQRFCALFGM